MSAAEYDRYDWIRGVLAAADKPLTAREILALAGKCEEIDSPHRIATVLGAVGRARRGRGHCGSAVSIPAGGLSGRTHDQSGPNRSAFSSGSSVATAPSGSGNEDRCGRSRSRSQRRRRARIVKLPSDDVL